MEASSAPDATPAPTSELPMSIEQSTPNGEAAIEIETERKSEEEKQQTTEPPVQDTVMGGTS